MNWRKNGGAAPNRTLKKYRYWPYPTYGDFFEYRFTKKEFIDNIKSQGFEVVEHNPIAVIDGIYHELNPRQRFVKYENLQFKPTFFGSLMQNAFSLIPFFHPHHQVAIVRKPQNSGRKNASKKK